MRLEVSRSGIIAQGDLISGSIGPISWVNPKLDLQLDREDQHIFVRGGATLGEVFTLDTLDLAISRDSLAFTTVVEIADGLRADIAASAAPSLTSPDFTVRGEIEGRYLDSISTALYARLETVTEEADRLVETLRSNASGLDLADMIRSAETLRDAARRSLQNAEDRLRALRAARSRCSWQVCVRWHDGQIAAWERVRTVRQRRYDTATSALHRLEDLESFVESAFAEVRRVRGWVASRSIVLTGAGFHTDLQRVLNREGFEVHIDGAVDGTPVHVSVDLRADLAQNVAALVAAMLPADIATLLHR